MPDSLSISAVAPAVAPSGSRSLRLVPDDDALLQRVAETAVELAGALLRRGEAAAARVAGALGDGETLTLAELRVLRFLPSYLTLGQIAARLHVSTNTVKTQAHAVYRKLGVSSRSGAVERAQRSV